MRLATQSTTQSFAQPLISHCDSRLRQSGQRDRDTQAHGRVQRVVKNVKVDATLQIALLALVPVCMLFAGSAVLFFSAKTVASFLQLLGSGFLAIVVLTHLSEALDLFPLMNWVAHTALVTISISGVLFLVSRCFQWDICYMR